MASDREIANLIVGSLGYRLTVGVVDKGKVASELVGVRKPLPGANLAKAAVYLARRAAPAPVPAPAPAPTPSALSPIWRADAIFTSGALSNFNDETGVRTRAKQTGWPVVYVQLRHTEHAAGNEAELPVFLREGWTAVGWSTYGQGESDPYLDGLAAAAICKRVRTLRGWKANGEDWAEDEHAAKTAEFLRGWMEGGAPVPLGWSVLSSDTANFARSFDYPTALSYGGADIDVQVYGATNPGLTVGAANGMLDKAAVPRERRTMSFDVDDSGVGPFADFLSWRGPRRLWNAHRATVATFDALRR